LDAIEELVADEPYRRVVTRAFRSLGDLERLIGRATQGLATPRELRHLRDGLQKLPEPAEGLRGRRSAMLADTARQLDPCVDVATRISSALSEDDGRTIRPGYSRELDLLQELLQSSRQWVTDLERAERERTGIRSLKIGFNRIFGYYLEVTRPNLELVPQGYVRKQTLANGERFITEQLKEMEARVLSAETRLRELETELFQDLLRLVAVQSARLLAAARAVALLDVVVALADLAAERDYVRPTMVEQGSLAIDSGRHPVVEARLGTQEFVPNSCALGAPHATVLVVTGPNMAGKSTFLRQVALITLLAQVGSFVPAREATIPLIDRIFTRIGAQDDLAAGASTFLVEMAETANILRHATDRSLVILDEVGRGTSTYDGLAIARAVLEDLHDRIGAKTLFATHYHELTTLAAQLAGIRNVHAAATEDGERLAFLYRILDGPSDRSYGIQVARLAGLPTTVVARATELLRSYQQDAAERRIQLAPELPSDGASSFRTLRDPTTPLTVSTEAFPAESRPGPDGQRFTRDQLLATRLLEVDLADTTPLAALGFLHGLQTEARRLARDSSESRPASSTSPGS
jgi:DNA mismatch repair protein MutS